MSEHTSERREMKSEDWTRWLTPRQYRILESAKGGINLQAVETQILLRSLAGALAALERIDATSRAILSGSGGGNSIGGYRKFIRDRADEAAAAIEKARKP